jgi:cation diffusion facilitator family transporter
LVFVVKGSKKDKDGDGDGLSNKHNNYNSRMNKGDGGEIWKTLRSDEHSKKFVVKEKINVAIVSIVASASLTLIKFIIATLTNSLGILSEAMHSGLDVLAAIMTLYAVKMAMKPPDLEHHYGYAKFESLTSLGEIILLFIIAGWVLYEGLERILYRPVSPDITIFSFMVMAVSIIIDFGRSRVLYKVAKKYGSQALEADALHFKVDMLTSFIVIIGLAFVYLFNIPNADSYAAIAIAGTIIYTSLGLGRRTLDVLLDKAPKGIQAQILESITGFEGIEKAHSIRVRKVGSETFIDMHIEVPRTFTHDKAHRIATDIENKIRNEILSNADVLVHVDAVEDIQRETIKDKIRLISADFPSIKNIHSIYLSNIVFQTTEIKETPDDQQKYNRSNSSSNSISSLHLYLDVQMDNNLDFRTAHDIIDNFEKRIKEEISVIKRITTHIETELDVESSIGQERNTDQSHLERIRDAALSVNGVSECKDISLVYVDNDLHITLTIKINPQFVKMEGDVNNPNDKNGDANTSNLSIEKAHQISTTVQNLIQKNTNATRVVVHAEPD